MTTKKNAVNFYRQGDVGIFRIGDAEDEVLTKKLGKEIKRDNGRIVVQWGEVTGHHHAIATKGVKFFEPTDEAALDLGNRILQVLQPATLTHDEHAQIELPAGMYEVRIQKEYTPQGLRNVAD